MKRIDINDWRYKLIVVMFGMAEKDLPQNSCQFHIYTILGVILYPFYWFPELIGAIASNDWSDFKTLLKPATDKETYYRSTKPMYILTVSFVLIIVSVLATMLIGIGIANLFHIDDKRLDKITVFPMLLAATLMLPVYAFIIQLIIRVYNKCKEYCKPIEYTGRYEYYEDEDFNMYVKNPVLTDKSKLYYEGAGPNWDEDDNDKRFFKMFISSELKHNKEDWMKAGLKEGTILTDEVFEEATKKAFNR